MTELEDNEKPILYPTKNSVSPNDFDGVYSLSEKKMVETFVRYELDKAGMLDKTSLVPENIIERKFFMNVLLSILLFVLFSSIFFHLSALVYIKELGILLIFLLLYFFITRFSFVKYLVKKIKENPKEKVSTIISFEKNDIKFKQYKSKTWLFVIVPIIISLIIFLKPRIIYEEVDGGYGVKYYFFGFLNYKTVEIPEFHNGKSVISMRGNTFSDMLFLEKVSLPDSIKEIRGQAFKNCINLSTINIPKNLEYLGGGAFYNAKSLKSIKLPDTLTYLGGESFYGASSLEEVVLSNNLTEIRGDTFGKCTSLRKIVIPDNITRIGGGAFSGDYNLSEIVIGDNSKLEEIGGGAFYNARSIKTMNLPNTITSIGGESFYGASSLEYITLPINLEEIRGDSFEYCTSLKKIEIPDSVTRIGGHAFYGDTNLSEVIIGENSKLKEIGSSAFRQCSSLYVITIPSFTSVNERAFKESPTRVHRY